MRPTLPRLPALCLALWTLLLPRPARAWQPEAVAAWSESVVRLTTGGAACTGVLVDDQGTVATAYHCVAGPRRPRVEARGGPPLPSRVVATSPRDDLALLRVEGLAGRAPRPLRAEVVRPGLSVLAIGHPFGGAPPGSGAFAGTLSWSVAQGLVSAVGERLIQTDAALNPGTSGGPVLDEQGAIVGIVSRKLPGEGLAFLAPVDRLRALVSAPTGARRLGGTVGLGVHLPSPVISRAARSAGLRGELALRDRLVLGMGAALPLDARGQALSWGGATFQSLDASLALRQRLGQGPWSTTVELGGGAWQLVDVTAESEGADDGADDALRLWTVQRPRPLSPGLTGRLSTRAVGLRLSWLPTEPAWVLGLEVGWPGTLGTF
ncbi:trypsin-like peptidase domain-containing protein [Myxococcota bacterium]|nr:trypsin-like peptidase domain-containing protein [Myxococcota bacterium]